MSAPKHTPGPWVIGGGGPSEHTILGGGEMHGRSIRGATLIACTEKCDEERANARLIASAPELLKWAEAYLMLLEGFETSPLASKRDQFFAQGTLSTTINQLRRVLALAHGGAE